MRSISANEAKARFGQLLDTARREPVTIEKHGRAVAVVISKEEYDAMEAFRLERLRAAVEEGMVAIERGDFSEVEGREGLRQLFDEIRQKARKEAAD